MTYSSILVASGCFDKIPKFRASPDYLVGRQGLLEIKCPWNSENHLETHMKREIPEAYLWQITAQLSVTGRKWCDFVSFDPRFPEDLQLVQIRVDRDQKLIQGLEVEVQQFLTEVEQAVQFLGARSKAAADEAQAGAEKISTFPQKAIAVF